MQRIGIDVCNPDTEATGRGQMLPVEDEDGERPTELQSEERPRSRGDMLTAFITAWLYHVLSVM